MNAKGHAGVVIPEARNSMLIKISGGNVGFDAQGQGTPLLLMHAFPLDRSMFQPQLTALARIARVLTFDVPGMGESEAGPCSMNDIADLAARLLDEHGIAKAVVGGVSMGGYASFAFARRHAQRLRGLVFADTKPEADTEDAKKARREMATVAREQGSTEIAVRMAPKLLGQTTLRERPEVVERVRSMILNANPKSIARLLESLAQRDDSTSLLGDIKVPALVIAGAEDAIIPAAGAKVWAEQIPGAKLVQIPQAGHLPNLETPAVFNSAIEAFLRKSTADGRESRC
jgi:pimeloyl-ACP methyl ester carboxylesterase